MPPHMGATAGCRTHPRLLHWLGHMLSGSDMSLRSTKATLQAGRGSKEARWQCIGVPAARVQQDQAALHPLGPAQYPAAAAAASAAATAAAAAVFFLQPVTQPDDPNAHLQLVSAAPSL